MRLSRFPSGKSKLTHNCTNKVRNRCHIFCYFIINMKNTEKQVHGQCSLCLFYVGHFVLCFVCLISKQFITTLGKQAPLSDNYLKCILTFYSHKTCDIRSVCVFKPPKIDKDTLNNRRQNNCFVNRY